MSRAALHSRIAPLATVILLISSAACTVPIAPGYSISKESREIQFVSSPEPQLKIRGRFTLVNSGNASLKFIDVVVPVKKTFGMTGLHAEIDGHEVEAVLLPAELQYDHPNSLRIPLQPAWEQKQKRELLIDYVLRAPGDRGSEITLGPKTFSLGFRGWFVVLQPPDHALSRFPARPGKTNVTIRAPANFLVLSRGSKAGTTKQGDETETRYLVCANDLAPFAVGGEYVATSARGGDVSVIFWTFQPLNADTAAAAQRIAVAWNTMQADFGPLYKMIRGPHVAESPELHDLGAGEERSASVPFPGGALVSSKVFAAGVNSDEFIKVVTRAIARNWFGAQIYAPQYAELGLGEGLPEYATIVIDEAREGGAARRRRVAELLHEYDEASKKAVEIRLGVAKMNDSPEQRAISLAKAPLFFIALEDECGQAPVRKALARVVSLLRGQEVDYKDVRSAIEQESGKDFAEFFRRWLYELGIPKEFRARYEPANEVHP